MRNRKAAKKKLRQLAAELVLLKSDRELFTKIVRSIATGNLISVKSLTDLAREALIEKLCLQPLDASLKTNDCFVTLYLRT
jgi:signal transduction histidine kinase